MKIIIGFILGVSIAVGGVALAGTNGITLSSGAGYVESYYDHAHKVICYTTGPSGISCLPMSVIAPTNKNNPL